MTYNFRRRLQSLNIFSQHSRLRGRTKNAHETPFRKSPEKIQVQSKHVSVTILYLLTLLALWGCTATKQADKPPVVLYTQINAAADPVFREAVEEVRVAGWPPYDTTLDPAAAAKADFRLNLDFQIHDKTLKDAERIWQMTTAMTLTLYPSSCARYEFELTADLYEQSGRRLKSWHMVEQDTAFLWFFQGDECKQQSDSTVRKISKSMLKDLYRRMAEDVHPDAHTADLTNKLPLVHITAINSKTLVQLAAKTDAPFSNFTFVPPAEEAIDYTLTIGFDSIRHEQSLFSLLARGMANVSTLGLVSFCPVDETILSADIQNAEGAHNLFLFLRQCLPETGVAVQYLTFCRRFQAHQVAQQRAFTATAAPHDDENIFSGNIEGEIMLDNEITIRHGQVPDFYFRRDFLHSNPDNGENDRHGGIGNDDKNNARHNCGCGRIPHSRGTPAALHAP